jgi:transmembrane sensor
MSAVAGSGGAMRLHQETRAQGDGMAQPPQLSDIDRTALAWFVANRGDDADAAAFDAWRGADPRHAAAYARIEDLWGSSAFVGAAKRARPRTARAAVATAALAVCLALSTGMALRLTGTTIAWPADRATAVGEIASTTLDDGSQVLLDTDTAIDIAMDGEKREVRLLRGRAFITVAADRRPFRVLSGEAVIRDIGTRFAVTHAANGERVVVAEGMVELRARDGRQTRNIGAGQGGTLSGGTLSPAQPINPVQAFGWTRHRLYFTNKPLGEVAEELRRYHRGWIVIGNDRAARLPISGGLNLDDPVAGMAELARLSGTRLTRVTDRILILR